MASHTFGSNNESNVDWSREKVTTIVTIANLLHNICSYCFHIGVWDGLGIVGLGSWCRAFPIQHIGDWPNSLDCTDLNQCGARRYAELCSSVTNKKNKNSGNCLTILSIFWHFGGPKSIIVKHTCISNMYRMSRHKKNAHKNFQECIPFFLCVSRALARLV